MFLLLTKTYFFHILAIQILLKRMLPFCFIEKDSLFVDVFFFNLPHQHVGF